MRKIQLNVAKRVVPMIYAYTTPEIERHNGWTKIGYTEQTVEKRMGQQVHTADVIYKEEWRGNAVFEDGSGDTFKDSDFHKYLKKKEIERKERTEWFKISGSDSRNLFYEFKSNRGLADIQDVAIPYTLRKEQSEAVSRTLAYINDNPESEYLWNAKPRFGKTLSVYELCKQMDAQKILIVTNRPAIANSWYSDYRKFLGKESGYYFISEVDALKDRLGVFSRDEFLDKTIADKVTKPKFIWFVSLQDLKGSIYFGGQYDKLEDLTKIEFDILAIDEAHEAVDTSKTAVAFNRIKRKFTLHLSGTPFKALASDKFAENAIYNWTYADEQKAKTEFVPEENEENPYATLPRLNLYTYQMSEIVKEEISQGIEIDGETVEYAFDLNEFFSTKNGKFEHEEAVDKFLDAMTTQEKFPFSTPELRNELKHTFWLLNRVESAKLLAQKLKEHSIFKDYEIILCAGDGKLSEDEANQKSFDKVVAAIKEHDKTISLSVGQLTTGITVPEWTAVLMLSNVKSPALYMQAAFRSQNPCLFYENGAYFRKENAYVFDFDPARTLITYEKFANDLSAGTSDGRGDADKRKENIKQLLNFFPVLGEDEDGEMTELDAEKVLSIPRKIRSVEVVKRGFMSNFLFQNISNVFNAPQEVVDILTSLPAVAEPKNPVPMPDEKTAEELHINENGEVEIPNEVIIGKEAEIFGDKLYDIEETLTEAVNDTIAQHKPETDKANTFLDNIKKQFTEAAIEPILGTAKDKYGKDMKPADQKRLENNLKNKAEQAVEVAVGSYNIEQQLLEKEKQAELAKVHTAEKKKEIESTFAEKEEKIKETLKNKLDETIKTFTEETGKAVVESMETKMIEEKKSGIEDTIRNHLRGFSRTIPSFLMAYGNDKTSLSNFDKIIPDEVFYEVTSISLDQFRFLRDGGDYTDKETGETKHFAGNLFDRVVFDDSVQEFLNLKIKLSDYFEATNTEDIFDYIPPQKTNQIFTPKKVVKQMVDMLEEENPGCFDNPDKTFIDLYMKSGLYITEIVKRLYQSKSMEQIFPNKADRLQHIFEKQVYGLAPTEIIYRIAISYILGFSNEVNIEKHNLRQLDALPYAKEGTLEKKLDEIF